MLRLIPALIVAFAPALALAAGDSGSSSEPPTKTKTTSECKNGEVFNEKTQKCEAPKSGSLEQDDLYRAVRELAYAGKYREATIVLDAMDDQNADRVLTYRGFIARKTGDLQLGMAFYQHALAINPDNLLVRSYMGQGFVEQGRIDEATDQLAEIVARGGAGTWPAESLKVAIATGVTANY